MNYILEEKISVSYNASSKARDDVAYFVSTYCDENGKKYKRIGYNDKTTVKTKFGKGVLAVCSLASLAVKLGKNDILFVQSSLKILNRLNNIKKMNCFKIIYLIHDLDAIRDSYDNDVLVQEMINSLNIADVLICHNDKMVSELLKRGCKSKMVSLDIFDYYTDETLDTKSLHSPIQICFAGNLSSSKTGFLYKLDSECTSFDLNVYGKKERDFKHLKYMGCFAPEELPQHLRADYGLIWEGNEFVYNENKHPYIMINNPHKTSLYIVSGLPIIIWEKAALAGFVLREGIGITISTISELDEKIQTIMSKQYDEMQKNLLRVRQSLLNGEHIHKAIREAETILGGCQG